METQEKTVRFKLASAETKIDHLETELSYLDKILIDVGFPEGIKTLKATVEEVIEEDMSA